MSQYSIFNSGNKKFYIDLEENIIRLENLTFGNSLGDLSYSIYTNNFIVKLNEISLCIPRGGAISAVIPNHLDKAEIFIKNLGTSPVLLDPQSLIDNKNDEIFVYPGESIELYGVDSEKYSGWIITSIVAGVT
jgi:hypothetical protein